jgi:hypothetical protein
MYELVKPYHSSYLERNKDFIDKNTSNWKKILKTIFGVAMPYPNEYKWTKEGDIINVLKVIGNMPDSNHLLLPAGEVGLI